MNKLKAPKRAKPAASAVANAASTPEASVAATLQMDANLEIKDVEDAHRRLVAAFTGVSSALRVDVSGIVAIDTAGIQLLLALQGESVNRGAAIEFCGESPAVNHALSVLGIPDALRPAVCRV